MRKTKKVFLGIGIFLICGFSLIIGYNLYEPINDDNVILAKNEELFDKQNNEQEVVKIDDPKVKKDTKFIYEYFYKQDNVTEKVEDKPPYFLIDLTRQELEEWFEDWEVKSFSSSEVVLKKIMDAESTQNYIIGDYDGYIAVYYEKSINGTNLKDITSIPVTSLPLEEQENIKSGIKIKGDDKLIEYISNYES